MSRIAAGLRWNDQVVTLLRYILFRTGTWSITGMLFMISLCAGQFLDASRRPDNLGTTIGVILTGTVITGLIGGVCAALWQLLRWMRGRHAPNSPALLSAVATAIPGMMKGAAIGFAIFFGIAVLMTGLFVLSREKTGMFLGSRIAWQAGCGITGAALGASIASIGGLLKRISALGLISRTRRKRFS